MTALLTINSERPRLGLALGGGVARGWAHIGVVRALARAGIEPDIICGTSIGAVVGGCHLAGKLDELEEWARSLNRLRVMSYMDFRVRQPGLIGGDKLARELRNNLGDRTIESLDRPFVTVAADLSTGHEIWLNKGSIVDAMRASFSLPGIFSPMLVDNRWLIDGALVNPVPVSVCVAQGADMVIAVNLNADIIGRARAPGNSFPTVAGFDVLDEMENAAPVEPGMLSGLVRRVFRRERDTPSLFGVMASSLAIVMDRITRSRLAGDPPDVHIGPKLGHIGLMEFDRAEEMIRLGEEATEATLPDIMTAMETLNIGHQRRGAVEVPQEAS
ncbi:patatin-like phospholipase family protein [Inquilinus sp. CAU 1745]|uniref:patatin-like phospholipase family protein n=1 Tax=Inquilinus sp. CAU 1745 TaxID=3140369 RepID=UPI00325C2592